MRHRCQALLAGALLCIPLAAPAAEETQSLFYDGDRKELTSSALVKLLNKKLGGVYQDLELVATACYGGELASRAAGLMGNWSVATATDADHSNTSYAGDIAGAGNFKIGGSTFNGWMPAWISKLTAEGNKIGNKALADYAAAEKEKAVSGSKPQYASSGKAADDMTLHGGAKSNHAVVFQTTGFVKLLDGTVSALKAAGYTDAEVNRLRGGTATWAKFDEALDDLRKKLDKNPKEEKALIVLETHGDSESRTVAYAPGSEGQAGGGALISAAAPVFTMEVTDPVVLATLGQDLPRPGGGVYRHDPELARYGPANLRLSTFEEHLANPSADIGVLLDGLSIGTLKMGASQGADYQLLIPDEVLSQLLGNVMAGGRLRLGLQFAAAGDWVRIATPQDWTDPTTAALDYGVGIAANCCAAPPVPEPAAWLLLAPGLLVLVLVRRRAWVRG